MANLPIEDLTTPVTRAEFETSFYRVMAAVGMRTSSWKPGAVVRAIVTASCVVLHAFSVVICQIIRSGFLDLASGWWLRLCASKGFGTDYLEASFATGLVRVDNTRATSFNESPGDVTFLGANDQEYTNVGPMVIAPNQTGVYVTVIAKVAGATGHAYAGTITRFGSTYPGLVVTNPSEISGLDDESDESLIARSKDAASALSPNGPRDAYRYRARIAKRADGTSLGINRVLVEPGPGDGTLTVYVANASGSVPGSIVDSSTDLGRIHYLLNTEIAPIGDEPTAVSASPVTVNVFADVWIYTDAGMSDAQATSAITASVSDYIKSVNIGGDRQTSDEGSVFRDAIIAAILGAIPERKAFHCVVLTPSANVTLTTNQVPIVGTLQFTIHWVSR